MRSDVVKKATPPAPNRSLLYALGYTKEELERPLIGVVCSYNEIVPGHMNLDKIAEAVKAGIRAAGLVSVILALSLTSAPVAVGMQYTATIWLFLLGLVQKKPFTLRAFFPVLVISLGVVCFMCSGTDGASQAGNLIALAEGVFFACLTVSSKRAAGTNPLGLTALANAFTGMLVFLLFPSALSGLAEMTAVEWAMMLVLGVIQVGLGYGCYNIGVQQVSAQKASVIALWEMILGPLWVALFLKEYPNFMVMAGLCIILLGMVMDTVFSAQGQESKIPS